MIHSFKLFLSSMTVFTAVVFAGGYAALLCERTAPGANIADYGDALWWALNVCSVGDASLYPITAGGRIVGALLIIIGYGCYAVNIGIVTAVVGHVVRKAEHITKEK